MVAGFSAVLAGAIRFVAPVEAAVFTRIIHAFETEGAGLCNNLLRALPAVTIWSALTSKCGGRSRSWYLCYIYEKIRDVCVCDVVGSIKFCFVFDCDKVLREFRFFESRYESQEVWQW